LRVQRDDGARIINWCGVDGDRNRRAALKIAVAVDIEIGGAVSVDDERGRKGIEVSPRVRGG
jgi:hypothetical protein